MGILIKIDNMEHEFTEVEKKIAKFILKNPKEVQFSNTQKIARGCHTSQASVVRFAKKLGFNGYPDFKVAFCQDLGKRSVKSKVNIIHEKISDTDTFEMVGEKIAHENITAINETLEIVNFSDMELAVKALASAKKILIVGSVYSGIAGKDFYYKLTELGKTAIMESDTHTQLSLVSTMGKEDLLFVISHSGKTKDIYNLTKLAKANGIKIISLTSIAPNPISNLADIKLSTVEVKTNFRASALSPRISQLTVVDMLYTKLMLENEEMQQYIFNAIELVKNLKFK